MDPPWIRKITTNPHTLAQVNIECLDGKYECTKGSLYQTWIIYETAGKDWIANNLATKIKQIFSRQRIKSPIILKQNEENVENGNIQEEIEKEEEDGLKEVRGSNSEQEGNAVHWTRNSVLVQSANEVFSALVDERSNKKNHLCNGNNDSVQLRISRRTKKNHTSRKDDFSWMKNIMIQ
jgi:hypothetical protein